LNIELLNQKKKKPAREIHEEDIEEVS